MRFLGKVWHSVSLWSFSVTRRSSYTKLQKFCSPSCPFLPQTQRSSINDLPTKPPFPSANLPGCCLQGTWAGQAKSAGPLSSQINLWACRRENHSSGRAVSKWTREAQGHSQILFSFCTVPKAVRLSTKEPLRRTCKEPYSARSWAFCNSLV